MAKKRQPKKETRADRFVGDEESFTVVRLPKRKKKVVVACSCGGSQWYLRFSDVGKVQQAHHRVL